MSRALFLFTFTIITLRCAPTWRRVAAVTLVAAVVSTLIFPPPVFAQFGLIGGIQNIINIVNGAIRSALNAVGAAMGAIEELYQSVVWPVDLIERARGSLASLIEQFRELLQSIDEIRTASATLPQSASLDTLLRNRQTNDFPLLAQSYYRVFGSLPAETNADTPTRNLVDMDDALALNTLKTLKVGDRMADAVLESGNQIEDEASSAAPGSAPFLTAASMAANIQSQAMMQKMLGAMLRQEAARLAHENALRKQRSAFAGKMRQAVPDVLIRR